MKLNVKRIIASTLLASILTTTACSSVPEEDLPVLLNFKNNDAAAVVAMIDSITEATLETESSIEAAYAAYYALEDNSQKQVTNLEKLQTLRDEIADLYEDTTKTGSRIDRSKILIGTYCFNYWDEAHVKEAADCGIDFIASAGYSEDFMNNLEKYGIGAFVSAGYFGIPSWRGGDRPVDAHWEPYFTIETYKEAVNNAANIDHPAIWGMELVDEPHSDDLPFIGQEVAAYNEVNPDKLVYINLFPNYAGPNQVGSNTYVEHVAEYVKNVNTDYISYDHYMYGHDNGKTVNFGRYIENMRIVADACRATNKDYWIVVQANSNNPDEYTSIEKLRFQAYSALAFGYTVINWACWNPGWFYNNICDSAGNKTEQYDKVQQVNAEINQLSPVFMKYKNLDANIIGCSKESTVEFLANDDNVIDQNVFTDIHMAEKAYNTMLCGYFEKRIGEGYAMMFVNITDETCDTETFSDVEFKVSKADVIVTEHNLQGSFILSPDENGYYKVSIENAEYSFVTVEDAPVEVAVQE